MYMGLLLKISIASNHSDIFNSLFNVYYHIIFPCSNKVTFGGAEKLDNLTGLGLYVTNN